MQKARRRPKASTACRHTVSGSFSPPYSGYFSPFPHGTRSLSVSEEYLALPDGPGRFRQGFTCPALLRILLGITDMPCTGLSPSMIQLSSCVPLYQLSPCCSPTTPALPKQHWFGLFPVRSPLLRESLFIFSSFRITILQIARFPHSEMHGSQNICFSPCLIAAYHVFHRLSDPRHPPCALSNLFVF